MVLTLEKINTKMNEAEQLLSAEKKEQAKHVLEELRADLDAIEQENTINAAERDIDRLHTQLDTLIRMYETKFQAELDELASDVTPETGPVETPASLESPTSPEHADVAPTDTEDVDAEEKSFFQKSSERVDEKLQNVSPPVRTTIKVAGVAVAAYAIYRGVSRVAKKVRGWFGGGEKQSKEKSGGSWFGKAAKWLGLGLGGVVAFSQWDNIRQRGKKLRHRDRDKENTDTSTITNAEKQKRQYERLSAEKKQQYAQVANAIIGYQRQLQGSYDGETLSPLHADNPSIAPMLLDGMYDNIGDILYVGTLTSEKRQHRREKFNTLIGTKSKQALSYVTDGMLTAIGIRDKHLNADGLTAEGWTLLDTQKDKLRSMQTQGFLDTKSYVYHLQGQLVRRLTAQALKAQNKPYDDAAIAKALEDDAFQQEHVEPSLDKIMNETTLADVPALLAAQHLDMRVDPELSRIATAINEEKQDLIGTTFLDIANGQEVLTHKQDLLKICNGAIDMTTDEELRENTDVWLRDVMQQFAGADDSIRERLAENTEADLRRDAYAEEIKKLQTKINTNTATPADIVKLEKMIDSMYHFKHTNLVGGQVMVEVNEQDGSIVANITEGGEMLYEWTFKEIDNKRYYGITRLGLGAAILTRTGRKIVWKVCKATAGLGIRAGAGVLGMGTDAVRAAMQEYIRRFNYRRSTIPGIKYLQLRKYAKTPDAMIDAFRAGYISLEQAARIIASRSGDTKRRQLMQKHKNKKWRNVHSLFSDNIVQNRIVLLEKIFVERGRDLKLLDKYVDQKGWRELLFKGRNFKGNTFHEIQTLMKKYDQLLGSGNRLGTAQKTFLSKVFAHQKLSLRQATYILDEKRLRQLNSLDDMTDSQLTQLAKKLPRALKSKEQIQYLTRASDKIKLKGLDIRSIKNIKTKLGEQIARLSANMNKMSGAEKATTQALLKDLQHLEAMEDADLRIVLKDGLFARAYRGAGAKLAPLAQRLRGIPNSAAVTKLLKSPTSRLLTKFVGKAFIVGDIGLSGYFLIDVLRDNNELGSYNPDKQQLLIEKNILNLGLAGVGTALVFMGPVGWIPAAAVGVVQMVGGSYYEVMEHYTTNLEEFARMSKPAIANHIIATLAGRSRSDKSWREMFSEMRSTQDLDYMGALAGDDAIEGWLRVDALERLSVDEQFFVQFHLAPSSRQLEMFAQLQDHSSDRKLSLGAFKQQAADIYTTKIIKPARYRYDEIKEQLGTVEITEQTKWGYINPLLPRTVYNQIANIYKTKETAEVLNLESLVHATQQGKGYTALMKLLNGGEFLATYETKQQTLDGVYHALWRVANEVYGAVVPYDEEKIRQYFAVGSEEQTGFWFTNKGKFGVSNERERDHSFTLEKTTTSRGRQQICDEIERAVRENDLISTGTNSGEVSLNQELGPYILAIFAQTAPKAPQSSMEMASTGS